jgi:F0F1-type ATP synthase assembly protein I
MDKVVASITGIVVVYAIFSFNHPEYNGYLLTLVLTIIAGLGGYSVKSILGKRGNKN